MPKENPGSASEEGDESGVMELLSPKRTIDLKIGDALSDLGESFSLVLLLPKENYELRVSRLLNMFAKEGIGGAYVALNKSTRELEKFLEKEGVETKGIHFIDAVTLMIEGAKSKNSSVTYIESPSELVELSVAIEKSLKKVGGREKFVVIDSLTTLLVYNNETSVEKFAHSLSQKFPDHGIKGVFLMTGSTNKKVVDTISQFCDKTFEL